MNISVLSFVIRGRLDLNQYDFGGELLVSPGDYSITWVTKVPPPSNITPPFSPVLLAGFALRPVPPFLFQPVLDAAMAVLDRRHPGIFDRISSYGKRVYLIDPVDLPYVFTLRMEPQGSRLVVNYSADAVEFDAAIRGPATCLLAMLEGRTDGDALFFSRDLTIEGDTEAVVALRNAIDDSEIDLKADLLSIFGPFSGPMSSLVRMAERIAVLAAQDLEAVRQAIISPSMRRHEAQSARLDDLSEKMKAGSRKR